MEIPRNKPETMRDIEWVARHMDFRFPEVSDEGLQAAFRKVMIEIAGGLYDYRAAEQVEDYLVAAGLSCPGMEKAAAAEGFARYSKIKDFIRLQMEVLQGASCKWQGHDPMHLEMWPAWSLVSDGKDDDLRERWQKCGGVTFAPLFDGQFDGHGGTGMIALKDDPIWKRLGDPTLFQDALGIDHPPFYEGSQVTWRDVKRIFVVRLGLIQSTAPAEAIDSMMEMEVEHHQKMRALLDKAVRESNEEYARRNSPEALLAKEVEWQKWRKIRDLTPVIIRLIKKAVANADLAEQAKIRADISAGLLHEKMTTYPEEEAILRRAMGHLEEAAGNLLKAREEYQSALRLDPKVGCQRDLKRVTR